MGAEKVKLKRRFSDLPPDTLILESSSKRPHQQLHYIREKPEIEDGNKDGQGQVAGNQQEQQQRRTPRSSPRKPRIQKRRRLFVLHYVPEHVIGKKREHKSDDLATFEEKRAKSTHLPSSDSIANGTTHHDSSSKPATPLKRPGKGAAVKRVPSSTPIPEPSAAEQQQIQELANHMHQAALDEVRREAAHRPPPVPRLSGERSRALHRQRAATNASISSLRDIDMGSDSDSFVYDTYILAPSSDVGAAQAEANLGDHDNVGYLVIASEDEGLWATYAEDDFSDADAHSDGDDEDENAEDFYGADYPEDELASDDEFDRNAYGFRDRRGSDGEEWDAAAGSDDEYDSMMNPFGRNMAGKFARYLRQNDPVAEDGDESE